MILYIHLILYPEFYTSFQSFEEALPWYYGYIRDARIQNIKNSYMNYISIASYIDI